MKSLNRFQPLGLLALRIVLGIIFFAHGYPKLVHLGSGMQGFFVQHGLPGYFVYISGVLEVFGSLLLAIEMGVAIWKVHSTKGYLAVHEYEFPLTLAMACFALATIGAGTLSLDSPLFERGGKK